MKFHTRKLPKSLREKFSASARNGLWFGDKLLTVGTKKLMKSLAIELNEIKT
jgi:hypothetical protein